MELTKVYSFLYVPKGMGLCPDVSFSESDGVLRTLLLSLRKGYFKERGLSRHISPPFDRKFIL